MWMIFFRYELTETDTEVTLSVNDAEKCDTGDYTIRVENALATDTASFHIAITGTHWICVEILWPNIVKIPSDKFPLMVVVF